MHCICIVYFTMQQNWPSIHAKYLFQLTLHHKRFFESVQLLLTAGFAIQHMNSYFATLAFNSQKLLLTFNQKSAWMESEPSK